MVGLTYCDTKYGDIKCVNDKFLGSILKVMEEYLLPL